MSEEEIANLQNILTRAQGGIMAKIGNWWKTRALPGLAPSQIAEEIMNVVRTGQDSPEDSIKAMESLSNLFQRLNSLKLPPATTPSGQPVTPTDAGTQPGQGTAGSQGAAQPAPGGQTTGQTAAQAPQATGQAAQQPGAPGAGSEPEKLAVAIGQVIGTDGANPTFVSQVKKLVDAGWKITPP